MKEISLPREGLRLVERVPSRFIRISDLLVYVSVESHVMYCPT